MKTHAEQNLERVLRIQWRIDETREKSQNLLLFEYLRRMALWTIALKQDYSHFLSWALLDVGAALDPSVRAPDDLIDRIARENAPFMVLAICQFYVHWGAVEDAGLAQSFGLPSPYDPAIMLFERGVADLRYHQGLKVNYRRTFVGLRGPAQLAEDNPMTVLDHQVLDQLDAQGDS